MTADDHYNQPIRRKADFITPPNLLKQKVGSGGLSEEILSKAEELLEHNTVEFEPMAELYLKGLENGINKAKTLPPETHTEESIAGMIYPAMQLKANGGMFHYKLLTYIGDRLVQFLEVIEYADKEAIEIIEAFHTTLRAVVHGRIKGDGGSHGKELVTALEDACYRYFTKNPDNIVEET